MTDELRQREPRVENRAFLAFLRTQRCCACGHPPPVQAAHLRHSDAAKGGRNPGIGAKPDDSKAVPLCAWCHLDGPHALHKIGEERFWRSFITGVVIDPFAVAAGLHKEFKASHPVELASKNRICIKIPRKDRGRRASKPRPKVRMLKRKWASRPFPRGRKMRIRP